MLAVELVVVGDVGDGRPASLDDLGTSPPSLRDEPDEENVAQALAVAQAANPGPDEALAEPPAYLVDPEPEVQRVGHADPRRHVRHGDHDATGGDPRQLPQRRRHACVREVLEHLCAQDDVERSALQGQVCHWRDDGRLEGPVDVDGRDLEPCATQPIRDEPGAGTDLEHPPAAQPQHLVDLVPR